MVTCKQWWITSLDKQSCTGQRTGKNVTPTETIPEPSAFIIYGENLVQKFRGGGKTFAQLADSVLSLVLIEDAQSSHTDVVFDVHWEISTKKAERCNRGSTVAEHCTRSEHSAVENISEQPHEQDKSDNFIVTDRISVGGNAIASVRPSVCLFPLYLRNRLTVDLELLHVSRWWSQLAWDWLSRS